MVEGERVWKKLFGEFHLGLAKLKFDEYIMYKAYVLFCNLVAAGSALAEPVVESWIKLGFDSDELIKLGIKRSVRFIENLAK